jgi:2-polyprenyl-3-methyl-5-hydroxy-6-metoxy-1,4-benzoquinol methylase
MEVNRAYWEKMYRQPLEELPWEIKEAPDEIREYVSANEASGDVALDAGCGTGNFANFLSLKGYQVVGVDYSEEALKIARDNSRQHNLPVRYERADLTELTSVFPEDSFDLILDYKVSHHMDDKLLKTYVAQCAQVLKNAGRLLLVCYSEKDADAAGQASATGKFGNEMYYRSAEEIRTIYEAFDEISYKPVMLGKRLNHAGHCFVFEKPALG